MNSSEPNVESERSRFLAKEIAFLSSLPQLSQFAKLLYRLSRMHYFDPTLRVNSIGDLLILDVQRLQSVKTFGRLYCTLFISLQDEIREILAGIETSNSLGKSLLNRRDALLLIAKERKLYLKPSLLSDTTTKALQRLQRGGILSPERFFLSEILEVDKSMLIRKGLGRQYVHAFCSLQEALVSRYGEASISTEDLLAADSLLLSEPLNRRDALLLIAKERKLYLKPSLLSDTTTKALQRLQRGGILSPERFFLSEILEVDKSMLIKQKGTGRQTFHAFCSLQEALVSRYGEASISTEDLLAADSLLLSDRSISRSWDSRDLEKVIIDDFEEFALSLDETTRNILCGRLGYNTEHKTLEEVGLDLELSRERIRQLESQVKERFLGSLRFLPKDLEQTILTSTRPIEQLFPVLYSCFLSESAFLSFLDFLCKRSDGFLASLLTVEFSSGILDDFFCLYRAPVSLDEVRYEIQTRLNSNATQTQFVISRLLSENIIALTSARDVIPKSLPVPAAMAQILLAFPNGLPWREMVRLCNSRGLTKEIQRLDRVVPGRVTCPGLIVLSGRGEYKHFKFLKFSKRQKQTVLSELKEYLSNTSRQQIGLQVFYNSSFSGRDEIDYYTCRHIVQEFGWEMAIHFNGQSRTDTVSLEVILSLRSQKDELHDYIRNSEAPCLQDELVALIKSRTLGLLKFYIHELLIEKRIIMVDENKYWVPEKVLGAEEINILMSEVVSTLKGLNRVVEADYFRELLNRKLNYSYSKYFYSSIIKYFSIEYSIVYKRSLFSMTEIPYSSMHEVFEAAAMTSRSRRELIERMEESFVSTRETYVSLLGRLGSSVSWSPEENVDF